MINATCNHQLVEHHLMCAWYCHTGQSMEGCKLAKKSHSSTAGPVISHTTASKNVLNDYGLIVQTKQHDKEVSLLSLEKLDNMVNSNLTSALAENAAPL